MLKYEFTSRALKQLKKLDNPVQIRIIEKLDDICKKKILPNDAKRLTDLRIGEYRIRIGDYRIIFDLEKDVLVILKVGHRRDIYINNHHPHNHHRPSHHLTII